MAERFADRAISPHCDAAELERYLRAAIYTSGYSVFTDYRIRPSRFSLSVRRLASPSNLKDYVATLRKYRRRRKELRPLLAHVKPIVKLVRGNWMLGWLRSHMNANAVLVVRHPGAVVESQARFVEHWAPHERYDGFLNDRIQCDAYAEQVAALGRMTPNVLQKLTALWCVENKIPVADAPANACKVFFYEDLRQPSSERLWAELVAGLAVSNVPEPSALARPSQQSSTRWKADKTTVGSHGPADWRDRLTQEQCTSIRTILDLFQIDFYRWQSDSPLSQWSGRAGSLHSTGPGGDIAC